MRKSAVHFLVSILGMILQSGGLSAQNLIANPGFEEYKKIPTTFCHSAKEFNSSVKGWTMPNQATSDYFNAKCRANASSIKNNFVGFQKPEEGQAYAGMYVCMANGVNYSEYLKTKLLKPLVAGQRYTIQFYISLAEGSESAIDRIGVVFMKENVVQKNLFPLPYKATVESLDSVFYDDKVNWRQVRLSFVANGGEKYMIIGNFHVDGSTHIKKVPVNKKKYYKENGCYYYLDDVCLAPEDENGNCFCPVAPPIDSSKIAIQKKKISPKKDSIPSNSIDDENPMVLSSVFFDTDKSTLKQESYQSLDSLADFLKQNPNFTITIVGHTDNSGDENRNLKLSQNRADAVMNYLISKGIDPNRISSEGKGSAFPVADNSTIEGRTRNRRVEYILQR